MSRVSQKCLKDNCSTRTQSRTFSSKIKKNTLERLLCFLSLLWWSTLYKSCCIGNKSELKILNGFGCLVLNNCSTVTLNFTQFKVANSNKAALPNVKQHIQCRDCISFPTYDSINLVTTCKFQSVFLCR